MLASNSAGVQILSREPILRIDMKLETAIIIGNFCGLKTVEECILNIELHYWNLLPPSELGVERSDFNLEVKKWEKGELDLDWDYINSQVEQQHFEYEEYCKSLEEHEKAMDDFDFFR